MLFMAFQAVINHSAAAVPLHDTGIRKDDGVVGNHLTGRLVGKRGIILDT